jgi:uncharacterized protein involved in cysteine biosynthesis
MEILKSRKFQASVTGIIVVIVSGFIPEIDEAELSKVVILIVSYVIGQGLADFGKERKK